MRWVSAVGWALVIFGFGAAAYYVYAMITGGERGNPDSLPKARRALKRKREYVKLMLLDSGKNGEDAAAS